jgi:hypothetical protein
MLKPTVTRDHLQLVADTQEVAGCNDKPQTSEQLALNLYETSELLFVRESDILENGAFSNLIDSVKPRWLFDVRITPRLDFLAPNRALAFKHFVAINLGYVDIYGALGAHSYCAEESRPESWGHFVAAVLSEATIKCGPYMFIFDDDEVLKRSRNILPSILQRETYLTDLKVSIFRNASFV